LQPSHGTSSSSFPSATRTLVLDRTTTTCPCYAQDCIWPQQTDNSCCDFTFERYKSLTWQPRSWKNKRSDMSLVASCHSVCPSPQPIRTAVNIPCHASQLNAFSRTRSRNVDLSAQTAENILLRKAQQSIKPSPHERITVNQFIAQAG
jgi:hypothetical protein